MDLQIFNNPQFGQIRTLEVNACSYFVGNDVALALGYAKPRNAISQHVDNEDTLKRGIPDNQGFIQETTLINESGMYALVFGSKLPTAKAFKRWVTSEVLPSIRKSGGYIVAKEDDSPEVIMARALQIANETIERSKQRIQLLESENAAITEERNDLLPMANYTKEVLQSTNTYTLTQVAHDLGLRSVHSLTRILKERHLIYRQSGQWQPTARVADKGYFNTRTAKFFRSDGTVGTNMTLVVTEKGRQFLHNLINGRN